MRPLTCVPLLAALAACPPGPGPTTDTDATSTITTGQTDASTGTSNPTTGTPDTTDGTIDGTGTTDLSTSTTAPVDVTTTTADPSTSSSDTSSDTSTGPTPDTSTGPGESALEIAIVDAELYADCQPRIDPDPVQGGWFVSFDNTGGAADTAATLVSATLSLADVDPPVLEPILVDPTDSGPIPAGQQVDQSVDKLHGDMHSACDHCGEFYRLVLTYDENGALHVAEEDVTIPCSF